MQLIYLVFPTVPQWLLTMISCGLYLATTKKYDKGNTLEKIENNWSWLKLIDY